MKLPRSSLLLVCVDRVSHTVDIHLSDTKSLCEIRYRDFNRERRLHGLRTGK